MNISNISEAVRLGTAYQYKLQALLYLEEAVKEVGDKDYKKHLEMEVRRLQDELEDLEMQIRGL
ncbi:hypothetical protein MWG07_11050 [Fusobacterium necrophorum]|uniref:Uncharacterized protein n=3 Tax=Fusobacterium TaxID=848 RepID=E5BFH5_9FUSO|nr:MULTISPECIES: hypothetical protein [Fusobacterium]EFS20856.1 hypothetical protein FSBG_00353 [Fusobacterium gonidiaformans 3-1-5R]EFS23436.1 hypothetical protein FSEG_01043 [Fusobacterium necrophorum D12]KXA11781.1 hypothetical protein HMPREF3206_01884 [Fusobacterium equinum]KYM55384.1 hypothetical protein A2U06_08015 [Fusobacterium necrophorum subsp. funduliforme]MDK4481906.1 hypothetical protein [Fusobacterium necrophorum]